EHLQRLICARLQTPDGYRAGADDGNPSGHGSSVKKWMDHCSGPLRTRAAAAPAQMGRRPPSRRA
ncbi:MAG: hypothetical protein ABI574_12105, partial [Burkholderiales bacterium]